MFAKRHIFKGGKVNRPSIRQDFTKASDLQVSADLRRILDMLPTPSPENNSAAFEMDNVAKPLATITVAAMTGDKIKVVCDKGFEKQEKRIAEWNANVNIRGDTIEDLFREMWIDNLVYGFYAARIEKNARDITNTVRELPDVQAMSPESIEVKVDSVNGWRMLEQTPPTGIQTYKTPGQFLRQDVMRPWKITDVITIADDPKNLMYCSLFSRPPMDTVLPFINMKYWIFTFMGKYAEKMWSSIFLAYKGDPKTNYYPDSKEQMDEALNSLSATLLKIKNFSVGAFPGDTRVESHSPEGNGDMYLNFYDKMNEEIMFGLFSSIASRKSAGVYKGNDTADEGHVRFMLNTRKNITDVFKTFYVTNLVDMPKENIHFILPELRSTSIENVIKTLEVTGTLGVFKDAKEKRRMVSQVVPWISDFVLTDEENTKLDKEFMDLNKPSEPAMGGMPSASTKNPKNAARSSGARGGRKS